MNTSKKVYLILGIGAATAFILPQIIFAGTIYRGVVNEGNNRNYNSNGTYYTQPTTNSSERSGFRSVVNYDYGDTNYGNNSYFSGTASNGRRYTCYYQ